MRLKSSLRKIEKEIRVVLDKVSSVKTFRLLKFIVRANRVFVTGQGRSGLVAEAFAMRLRHLGLDSFIVGESTCPSISKDDLLIAISGSGSTKITMQYVKEAKSKKFAIVGSKGSKLSRAVDEFVYIPAGSKIHTKSVQPMGTLFEQSCLIYLDDIVLHLMKILKVSRKDMKRRHTKLE